MKMDVFTMKQCMDSENLHKRLNRISGQIGLFLKNSG